jgi:hypothetical protein
LACIQLGDGSAEDPVTVQTAEDDILKGTVRQIFLEACAASGIRVALEVCA